MRQPVWFRLSSTPTHALWRYKAAFFIGISVLGTFLALTVLIFDGWIDALAIYVICSLLLAILLSRFAAQQKQSSAALIAQGIEPVPGSRNFGLTTKRSFWFEAKDGVRPLGADQPVLPAVLSKITPRE